MKKILFLLILCAPLLVLAEYNGVHIEFKIQQTDGKEIVGYKYMAHVQNNEDDKKELESTPDVLFRKDFTFEPGEYCYYQKRLQYQYQEAVLYKLVDPVEIKLDKIKSITITDMIVSSYDIQIASEHKWADKTWMNTEPIIKYSSGEEMCIYDIFVHQSGAIPNEAIEKLKSIIEASKIKIAAKQNEIEGSIASDKEYYEQMEEIFEERSQSIKILFDQYENFEMVIVSMCSC